MALITAAQSQAAFAGLKSMTGATGDVGLPLHDLVAYAAVNGVWILPVGDQTTALTAAAGKRFFRVPFACTVTGARCSVNTAPTGSTILVDINDSGTTILSTKLMIDASEKTSVTAATPYVISDTALDDDAEISIDLDQVGSSVAGTGLVVYLYYTRA